MLHTYATPPLPRIAVNTYVNPCISTILHLPYKLNISIAERITKRNPESQRHPPSPVIKTGYSAPPANPYKHKK